MSLSTLTSGPASPPAPAPAAAAPHSFPRVFLERLSRPLLDRLVTPFAAPLAALGFSLSALAASPPEDRRLVRRLHDLLDPSNPELAPLCERLAAVARVATTPGREALIKLDVARALPARLGPEDLAAVAYLDFPALFASVRVGSAVDGVKSFVLYKGAPARAPCFDDANIESAKGLLARWFEARHRTTFCEILMRARGIERHFEIIHGSTPVTQDIIDEALSARVVTQVNATRSFAVYDEHTEVLAIHALEYIKDGIRGAFGEGFCGSAEHFAKAESLLDGAPFRDDLRGTLAPDASLGVYGVCLREIEVYAEDGSRGHYLPPKGADILTTRQQGRIDEALREDGAYVSYLKLAVDLGPGRRLLLVEISPPRNQFDYDRRDAGAERALLAWLAARGVWHGSKPRAAAAASA